MRFGFFPKTIVIVNKTDLSVTLIHLIRMDTERDFSSYELYVFLVFGERGRTKASGP